MRASGPTFYLLKQDKMVTGGKDIMNSTSISYNSSLIQYNKYPFFQQTDFLREESLAYLAIIDLTAKK